MSFSTLAYPSEMYSLRIPCLPSWFSRTQQLQTAEKNTTSNFQTAPTHERHRERHGTFNTPKFFQTLQIPAVFKTLPQSSPNDLIPKSCGQPSCVPWSMQVNKEQVRFTNN